MKNHTPDIQFTEDDMSFGLASNLTDGHVVEVTSIIFANSGVWILLPPAVDTTEDAGLHDVAFCVDRMETPSSFADK